MTETRRYGTSSEHFGELWLPDEPSGTLVVLIHGGFWRDHWHLDLMHPLAEDLVRRGHAAWNIEYRRVGPTGGGHATTTADVAAAIDRRPDGPWSNIAVVGHSAGGHLALWNAGRPNADVVADLTVGLAPVADVIRANREGTGDDATANFFGGDVDDVPDAYALAQPRPSDWRGRIVLIHGTADENVPVHQSGDLDEVADRVEILDGVDHFDVIDPAHHSWQIVVDELDALTSQSATGF